MDNDPILGGTPPSKHPTTWMMPAYSRKIAFFTAAVFVVSPLQARAGMAQAPTVGALMSKACPAAHERGKEQERAQALSDDSRFALAKKNAALYYDCYQQLSWTGSLECLP